MGVSARAGRFGTRGHQLTRYSDRGLLPSRRGSLWVATTFLHRWMTSMAINRFPSWLFLFFAVAFPNVSRGDSGLYWLYQSTGVIPNASNSQTAVAMGGSKSWPVVFAATSASGLTSVQPLTLGAFRNPASNTYWSPLGAPLGVQILQPFKLTAASTTKGQIGFAVTNFGTGSTSIAYTGSRQSGFGDVTVGALGLAVNPNQELLSPTFASLAGSGILAGSTRGVAIDPFGNLGAVVATNSTTFSYYEKNGQSGWQSSQPDLGVFGVNNFADIAYDGSGSPVIAYSSGQGVMATHFDIRSGQWQQTPLGIGNTASGALLYPTVATDSKGGVGVSWVSTAGTSMLMYAYKPRDGAWAMHPVTSSVSVPLSIGASLFTESVRAQTRVGLDFDANDLPVISFLGASGRVYLAYDPVIPPNVVPDIIREVGGDQQQVDSTFVTGAFRLVKQGAGTLVREGAASNAFGTLVEAGELIVNGVGAIASGSLTVMPNATVRFQVSDLAANIVDLQPGARLSVAANLQVTIGGLNPNAGGLIDIGTGEITVASGLSVLDLSAALQSGRGNGSWNGSSGITSSAAASSNGSRTVGWLDNGNGSLTFGYAASGDTNLDWTIDILDVANFIGSGRFDSGLTATWSDGDFNYDGFADILDVAEMITAELYNVGNYNGTPAGMIAAVPEPSTLGLVGVGFGLAGFVTMRRKRAA